MTDTTDRWHLEKVVSPPGMTAGPKRLGPHDEPQQSGAVVAVHYGDYRRQEVWVASGAFGGNWFPLGGEFGRPKVWRDPRTEAQKIMWHPAFHGSEPRPGPDEVPQYPHWSDVLARGPVTLLVPGDAEAYRQGWRNGRKDLWDSMENEIYDDPREVPA
jgi:hypothetical protein